jgi:hypothetical protein
MPLEDAVAIEPDRSNWLAGDLEALDLKRPFRTFPKCWHLTLLYCSHLRLGAPYVADGLALGGMTWLATATGFSAKM